VKKEFNQKYILVEKGRLEDCLKDWLVDKSVKQFEGFHALWYLVYGGIATQSFSRIRILL
jgi:hypothetical protein